MNLTATTKPATSNTAATPVVVVDIDIPFRSVLWLMFLSSGATLVLVGLAWAIMFALGIGVGTLIR